MNSKREEETPQEIVESSTRELTFLADHCEHRSGDLFAHIDTVSAAKDFDMVREVLDQPNFNYLTTMVHPSFASPPRSVQAAAKSPR